VAARPRPACVSCRIRVGHCDSSGERSYLPMKRNGKPRLPAGAKARVFWRFRTARLKSCPSQNHLRDGFWVLRGDWQGAARRRLRIQRFGVWLGRHAAASNPLRDDKSEFIKSLDSHRDSVLLKCIGPSLRSARAAHLTTLRMTTVVGLGGRGAARRRLRIQHFGVWLGVPRNRLNLAQG